MNRVVMLGLCPSDLIKRIRFPKKTNEVDKIVNGLKPSDFKVDIKLIHEATYVDFFIKGIGSYNMKDRGGKCIWGGTPCILGDNKSFGDHLMGATNE